MPASLSATADFSRTLQKAGVKEIQTPPEMTEGECTLQRWKLRLTPPHCSLLLTFIP